MTLDIILRENKLVTKQQILYDSVYLMSLQQSNPQRRGKMMFSRAGEGRNGKLVFSEYQVVEDEKILARDAGNG